MNVYIWERIEDATDSYHSGGGVVVIADTEAAAREAAASMPGCTIKPEELPTHVVPVSANYIGGVQVFIFPDAGCC